MTNKKRNRLAKQNLQSLIHLLDELDVYPYVATASEVESAENEEIYYTVHDYLEATLLQLEASIDAGI